jgi:hypothetical protein
MAKTITKKVGKPLSPKPAVEQADTAYLVREDLDEEQERRMKAAAAEANALTTPTPAASAERSPAPAAVLSNPLAPLAALWPDPVPSKGKSRPSQAPAPKVESAPAAAIAPKPAAPKTLSVRFALHKPDAKGVSLCGDFNGWSPSATPMKRHEDGHWEATVALAPGRYQYKFIVDGEWIADPAAQKNMPNEHGSLNSVIEVRA